MTLVYEIETENGNTTIECPYTLQVNKERQKYMLDADVKERVRDLAWELGYDWDDEKVEGLFKSFIDQHPDREELLLECRNYIN